jgi:3',5'-cyclic AMP phosphodiesterase CpdA
MRLAWVTDIHLNAAAPGPTDDLVRSLVDSAADALLVGGDTGESDSVAGYLSMLADRLRRPIWFVLGNHDFYGGRLADVRAAMRTLSLGSPWLRWLPAEGEVGLTKRTALVGHDGWADGRLGLGTASRVILNDYLLIGDLMEAFSRRMPGGARSSDEWHEAFWAAQGERFEALRALGEEAASHVRAVVPRALDRFEHVLFLTHVPPFREACWHDGHISDDEWLPHMTCAAVGLALRDAMEARLDRRMTVLCGHTHGEGFAQILPNLVARTGGARYGDPVLQAVIEVE